MKPKTQPETQSEMKTVSQWLAKGLLAEIQEVVNDTKGMADETVVARIQNKIYRYEKQCKVQDATKVRNFDEQTTQEILASWRDPNTTK